jgi:hypothetical protein
MKNALILFFILSWCISCWSQEKNNFEDWSEKPAKVNPSDNNLPPSDTIVLFQKNNLGSWQYANGENQNGMFQEMNFR